MKQDRLNEVLLSHKKWLQGESDGKCADLRGANLSTLDLRGFDLSGADISDADLSGSILKDGNFSNTNLARTNLTAANLSGINLEGANLSGSTLVNVNFNRANLSGANLTGVIIDYSSWPLWCGTFGVRVSSHVAKQLAYHFCALNCDDEEFIKARGALLSFANKSFYTRLYGVLKEEA